MLKKIFILSLPCLFLILHALKNQAFSEIVVVVHPSNSLSSLSPNDVKMIYLGNKIHFDSGKKIAVVDQKNDEPARADFFKKAIKIAPEMYRAYWTKRIFSGKGVPPKQIGSDKEVLDFISKTPDGVGYLNANSLNDSVKKVLTLP
jgi:ABC-type phosphate transport system substrate-binding protein